jgi:hypothetical protein
MITQACFIIEVKEILDAQEQEELMSLSQVFLDLEQRTIYTAKKQTADLLVLRLLNRLFGEIAPDLKLKVQELSLDQIEALGEALLDFSTLDDLVEWLRFHSISDNKLHS